MRSLASPLLLCAALLVGACGGPQHELDRAAHLLEKGRADDALADYGKLADSPDGAIRVRASVGAARAARALHDERQRRYWLERAVADPQVPGESEEAYYEYAELLRAASERSLALNFYYRAAAAENSRRHPEVYRRAVSAIATMGMAP